MEHSIGGHTLDEIHDAVSRAVGAYLTHRKNTDRVHKGGYCTVYNRITGEVVTTFQVGKPAVEKAERYRTLSVEKCTRLARTHVEHGHVSSWQSRDEGRDLWGGAIMAGEHIISFSGFAPDTVDEAIVVKAARELGWLADQDVLILTSISNNDWTPLLRAA